MHAPNQISLAAKASGEPDSVKSALGRGLRPIPVSLVPMIRLLRIMTAVSTPVLLNDGDRRNVLDRYRYWTVAAIKADLDARGASRLRKLRWKTGPNDFNIGSMVRTANAFQAKRVHIVGPHKWNPQGRVDDRTVPARRTPPSIAELVESWHHRIAGEIAYERAKAGAAAVHAHDGCGWNNKHLLRAAGRNRCL